MKEPSDFEVVINTQHELIKHIQSIHATICSCNIRTNGVNMERRILLHLLQSLSMSIENLLENVNSLESEIRKGTINP